MAGENGTEWNRTERYGIEHPNNHTPSFEFPCTSIIPTFLRFAHEYLIQHLRVRERHLLRGDVLTPQDLSAITADGGS